MKRGMISGLFIGATLMVAHAPASAATIFGILDGNSVGAFDSDTLAFRGSFAAPGATGVAAANGQVYVASGSTLTKYSEGGVALGSFTFTGFTLGSLAVDGDRIYSVVSDAFASGRVVEWFNPDTLKPESYIEPGHVTGLSVDDGRVYVAQGSMLARYTTGGVEEASFTFDGFTLGSLSFDGDRLYSVVGDTFVSNRVVEWFDPKTLKPIRYIEPLNVSGMTVKDGAIYVAQGGTLSRYTDGGVSEQSAALTGNHIISSLFYASDAPAVPEPSTWLMMIAGFGLVGQAMRGGRADGRRSAIAG